MARILICHVPKDGSVARELGSALMGRGHFVSFDGEPDQPRDDRSARLRQFEAVIVVWTETSAQNIGLSDIAREVMPLNQLVPVRADDLSPARLPLMFRKLSMIAPRDIDGIARVVARMSTAASSLREMAERDTARRTASHATDQVSPGAAQGSPYVAGRSRSKPADSAVRAPNDTFEYKPGHYKPTAQSPVVETSAAVQARPLLALPEVDADEAAYGERQLLGQSAGAPARGTRSLGSQQERPSAVVATAEELGRAMDSGLLVPRIPVTMWLGEPTTVEFTLGRDFISGLSQSDLPPDVAEVRQSLETLSISLYGEAASFEIERQSERTQFVNLKLAMAARDPETFGRWAWLVTPRAAGSHDVVVRVSALMRDRNGVPAPVALPDRRISITVAVPENTSLVSALAGWYRR
jgi:hypothetical protein